MTREGVAQIVRGARGESRVATGAAVIATTSTSTAPSRMACQAVAISQPT